MKCDKCKIDFKDGDTFQLISNGTLKSIEIKGNKGYQQEKVKTIKLCEKDSVKIEISQKQ